MCKGMMLTNKRGYIQQVHCKAACAKQIRNMKPFVVNADLRSIFIHLQYVSMRAEGCYLYNKLHAMLVEVLKGPTLSRL